jgi:hypothetical protein
MTKYVVEAEKSIRAAPIAAVATSVTVGAVAAELIRTAVTKAKNKKARRGGFIKLW